MRRKKKKKSIIRKLFVFVLTCFIFISAFVVGIGWVKYEAVTRKCPLDDAISQIKEKENYTNIDDISLTFINAMVAVEDRRFYKHNGVDVIGIARAFAKNVKDKTLSEGGSCITQQLAKNMYFINDNTLSRKIAEIFISVELEKKLSKKEILELYFNVIYYGSGYYNIYDASMGYFNKTPAKISDYEATLLAGIPNAPSVYSLKNNPDLAKQRQKTVVNAMVDMKYLTNAEAKTVLARNK